MNPNFNIRRVAVAAPHAYVVASILSPLHFSVSKGSRLGGVRLKSFLKEPNPGSYTFQIEDPKEALKLREGDTVELTS